MLDACYLLYEEYLKPWLSNILKMFRMNNKTIIEFGFRMMWRIMLISEAARHRFNNSFNNCLNIPHFLYSYIP